MMKELYAQFSEYEQEYQKKKRHLELLIDKHQQSLKTLDRKHKSWYDKLLIPLANAIAERLGGLEYRIYGPFGLNCETSVYFFPTVGHDITEDETYCITVYPAYKDTDMFGTHLTYDTGKKDDIYAEGTIGWLNGFNKVQADLPDSIDEIVDLLRHIPAKGGAEKC